MKQARPGGRTAQTRAAVAAAAESLLAEVDPADIAMVDIARRAGVAASSLYRRWGDVRTLLTEVAVERLLRDAPLPDTGALGEDLRAWAHSIAASLSGPQGSVVFRVVIAAAPRSAEERSSRLRIVSRRLEQIAALLERARARGERAPRVVDVTDHLLAPLYMRAVFGAPVDADVADQLVDTLLTVIAAARPAM